MGICYHNGIPEVRLIIYGLIAFFVPFSFVGGVSAIKDYLGMFVRYTKKNVYSQTSIIGNCILLFGDYGKNIGKIVVILWILWIIYCLFTDNEINWKSIALLTSTQTIIIPESYVYTYVFIAIPCIEFLNSLETKECFEKMDYLYAFLFALVFVAPSIIFIQSGVLIGIYFSWIILLMLISIEKVVILVNRKYLISNT